MNPAPNPEVRSPELWRLVSFLPESPECTGQSNTPSDGSEKRLNLALDSAL
jgi:hypothetical protein